MIDYVEQIEQLILDIEEHNLIFEDIETLEQSDMTEWERETILELLYDRYGSYKEW